MKNKKTFSPNNAKHQKEIFINYERERFWPQNGNLMSRRRMAGSINVSHNKWLAISYWRRGEAVATQPGWSSFDIPQLLPSPPQSAPSSLPAESLL